MSAPTPPAAGPARPTTAKSPAPAGTAPAKSPAPAAGAGKAPPPAGAAGAAKSPAPPGAAGTAKSPAPAASAAAKSPAPPGAPGAAKSPAPTASAGAKSPAPAGTGTAKSPAPAAPAGAKAPAPAGAAPGAPGAKAPPPPGAAAKSPAPATAAGAKSPAPPGTAGAKSPAPAGTAGAKSPAPAGAAKSPAPAGAAAPGAKSPAPPGAAPVAGKMPAKSPSPAPPGAKSPAPAGIAKAPGAAPPAGAAAKGPPVPGVAGKKSPVPAASGKVSPAPPGAVAGKKSPTPAAAGVKGPPVPGAPKTMSKSPAPPGAAGAAKGLPPAGPAAGKKSPPPAAVAAPSAPAAAAVASSSSAGVVAPPTPMSDADVPPPPPPESAPDTARSLGDAPPPPPPEGDSAVATPRPIDHEAEEAARRRMQQEQEAQQRALQEQQRQQDQMQEQHMRSVVSDSPGPQAAQRARKRPIIERAPRTQSERLTVDPRSGLLLVEFPRDRVHNFAHLGQDIVMHLFMDVDRITSRGNPVRRVLFITDQTLFICEENGAVSRCVPVNSIMQVNVAQDTSNGVAFVIPSEYDIVVKPDRKQQRDDLIVVLRAVYRRLTSSELNVQAVKEIKTNQYRMDKPQGFQLQRIGQRSRANLQAALDAIEQEELERARAIQAVQQELHAEHEIEMEAKLAEMGKVQLRLDQTKARIREQHETLERLRAQYGKMRTRVEEIEAQMQGAQASETTSASKDVKIRELQEVVDALTQAVGKANEERLRIDALRRRGDFEEVELDHVETQQPRFRGRSLHHQGLIEVLQRQLIERRQVLAELQARQVDVQRLNHELAKKEEMLREYEQLVPNASRESDPMLLYSDLPGSSVQEMLDRRDNVAPPPRLFGAAGVAAGAASPSRFDPMHSVAGPVPVASQDLATDEDGELFHRGNVPQHKVVLSNDLPEYRLPDDERDFVTDPRTQLKFVDIPSLFKEFFKNVADVILHFFSVASKSNKRGREQKRVIMLSDRVLYQCTTSGNINRCVPLTAIREVQIDQQANVALVIDGKNEYDMCFRFENITTCEDLANVVKRTTQFLKRQPPVKITRIERLSQGELRLEKPPSWEFQLLPLAPKRALYRALKELSQTTAKQRARMHEQADFQTMELINRLKEEMRPEILIRREREFSVLRQQLTVLDAELRAKQQDSRLLRRKIQDHRCTVDSIRVAGGSAGVDSAVAETPGMYWIPSDPVVMECSLDILHICFQDNFVVTSHANGILHVWDLATADLFRTLKSNAHTARVQAFHFEGTTLISGGFDGALRQWSIVEGTCTRAVPMAHKGGVTALKFDTANLITGGTDAEIYVWDVASLKLLKNLKGHRSAVTALAFQRNTLASAEWGWVFVWDIERGIATKVLRDDNGGILTLDIQGSTVVTGGTGGVLTCWNVNTSEGEALEGHTDDVHCVQLQGQFAISSSSDGTIRMWNAREKTPLGVFHNCAPSECRTFHFKANRFVIGEGRTIKAWTR